MDISKEYIKMASKAEEVQCSWKTWRGDYYTYKLGIRKKIGLISNRHWSIHKKENLRFKNNKTWLPRQDQLQEMMWKADLEGMEKATSWDVQKMYFDLMKEVFQCLQWYDDEGYDYNHLETMEQLWLAFVMKEKFNKVWNGEDWEKKNT